MKVKIYMYQSVDSFNEGKMIPSLMMWDAKTAAFLQQVFRSVVYAEVEDLKPLRLDRVQAIKDLERLAKEEELKKMEEEIEEARRKYDEQRNA